MLFNLIMISLIIQSVLHFFRPQKNNVLMCGIWGFYGTEKARKREFNWLKFDWMGAVNDERGGDACGRITGTYLEHSNDVKKKKYNEYSQAYYPPAIPNGTKIIFGHTRKMSLNYNKTGGIEYSQPVVFYNEENTPSVVGVHNGTIYNYKKMLENNEIPLNSLRYRKPEGDDFGMFEMNDSQSLIKLIGVEKKYQTLIDYQGGAAFAIYDYATDELILWSGASRSTSYVKFQSRERPLYIIKGKDFVWFSSVESALLNINYNKDLEVEEVPENTLQMYKDGILISETVYDRSESCQIEIWVNHKKENRHEQIRFCPVCSGTGKKGSSDIDCRVCDGTGFLPIDNPKLMLPAFSNSNELSSEQLTKLENYIEFKKLRYFINGNLAHGVYHLNVYGRKMDFKVTPHETNLDQQITRPYYFIFGCMMDDHVSWMKWSRKVKRVNELNSVIASRMAVDCMYPIYFPAIEKCVGQGKYGYNGEVNALFADKKYWFMNGNFTRSEFMLMKNYPDHGESTSETTFASRIISGAVNSVKPKEKVVIINKSENNENFDSQKSEVDDLPFKADSVEVREKTMAQMSEEYEKMVKKEMQNQIANILISLNDSKEELFPYLDNEKAEELDLMIEEWEDKLKRLEAQYENGSDL